MIDWVKALELVGEGVEFIIRKGVVVGNKSLVMKVTPVGGEVGHGLRLRACEALVSNSSIASWA